MRRASECCGDCAPGQLCPGHLACATHPDAALAAEIGIGWAVFVRHQVDVRQPWPPFRGRTADIAIRLAGGLAISEPRRSELARIVTGARGCGARRGGDKVTTGTDRDEKHYVLVLDVTPRHVVIADPHPSHHDTYRMTTAGFERAWTRRCYRWAARLVPA